MRNAATKTRHHRFIALIAVCVLIAALAAAGAIARVSTSAFATLDEEETEFTVDGVTYSVTSSAEPREVQLYSVDMDYTGALDIPEQVTSPDTGLAYDVTSLRFAAFSRRDQITSLSIPETISSYTLNVTISSSPQVTCLNRMTSLSSVTVAESCNCLASIDGVLYARNSKGEISSLLCYPQAKSDLASFTVPESVSTIFNAAFRYNEYLREVIFQNGLVGDDDYDTAGSIQTAYTGGMGTSAFEGCTNLETVTFPTDATLATRATSMTPALGTNAFAQCTSLTSIVVPAITTSEVKSNAYSTFAELNPNSNFAASSITTFYSGYMAYWHNGQGPIARVGIGQLAFSGCTSLENVTFAAGSDHGAFSYWTAGDTTFLGCTNLKSLVFESGQAYWGNPNQSMQNASFRDIWSEDYNNLDAPTYYLAVDYYITSEDAEQADTNASTRLCRVEYARETSVADIATSSEALAGQTVERKLYAQTDADGVIPDPNETAAAAGLDTSKTWAWKLEGAQSRQTGLTESCSAYLVEADSLQAARLGTTQTQALYRQVMRNLSADVLGVAGDTLSAGFDPERYCNASGEDSYVMDPMDGETDVWYTYTDSLEELEEQFCVELADGTVLDSSTLSFSYQRYDAETGTLVDATVDSADGPYLVTISYANSTDASDVLREWVFVTGHTGTLSEAYADCAVETSQNARYANEQIASLDYSSAPYSVTVGESDPYSALIASGYAGLVKTAIVVDSSTSETYGFALNFDFYPNGSVRDSSSTFYASRTSGTGDDASAMSAAEYAVRWYETFERSSSGIRDSRGVSSSDYPWSNTALLVPATYVSSLVSISAYAYATGSPVFFTADDGSVDESTLSHLNDFSTVIVAGTTEQFSQRSFSQLQSQLDTQTTLERLCGESSNTGTFSLAVAQELESMGLASAQCATVSDATTAADAVAALSYSGFSGGFTFATCSTQDSVEIARFLHERNKELDAVILYGRPDDNATYLQSIAWDANAFGAIWSDDATFEAAMAGVIHTVQEPALPTPQDTSSSSDFSTPSTSDNTLNASSADTQAGTSDVAASTAVACASSTSGSSGAGSTGSSSSGGTAGNATGTTASNASLPDTSLAQNAGFYSTPTSSDNLDLVETADTISQVSKTPLAIQVPFLIALIALCCISIPLLRKCR